MLDHDTIQIKMSLFFTSRNAPNACPSNFDFFRITGSTWLKDPKKARRMMHKEIDRRLDELLKTPYNSGGVSSDKEVNRSVSRRNNNKGTQSIC